MAKTKKEKMATSKVPRPRTRKVEIVDDDDKGLSLHITREEMAPMAELEMTLSEIAEQKVEDTLVGLSDLVREDVEEDHEIIKEMNIEVLNQKIRNLNIDTSTTIPILTTPRKKREPQKINYTFGYTWNGQSID